MPEDDTSTSEHGSAPLIEIGGPAVAPPTPLDLEQLYAIQTAEGGIAPLDLEQFRVTPDRPRGEYRPATVESFIDYVTKHEQGDQTTVWVHPTEGEVVAILDDNAAEATGWGSHVAKLVLQQTTEWAFWTEHDGELMDQQSFAELLKEGLPDIIRPDGADLLEIAQKFQAKTEVHFRSGVDLSSGEVKFKYDEEVQATSGTPDGEVAVPRTFMLALAPFIGEDKVEVEAELRHRTGKGSLKLGYKLSHPERVVESVLERIATALAEHEKLTRVYRGTPAA